MSTGSPLRICVVGAGVVGMTCAIVLAERHDVTVVAERFGAETDSVKATAVWHVYLVPETDQVLRWAGETLTRFHDIVATDASAGLELVAGVELYRRSAPYTPSWSHIPRRYTPLTPEEISIFNCIWPASLTPSEIDAIQSSPVTWGYHIEAPAANMGVYLPWLERTLRARPSVRVERRSVNALAELAPNYDLIVNCCGFGAKVLVADADFEPYKGQYFILRGDPGAPVTYVGDDEHPLGMAYMIPRAGEVIVGGCAERGLDDLVLTLDFAETVRRAGLYVPWLVGRGPHDQGRPAVVGIRPCRRSGIRLEIDRAEAPIPVIHNYGHGGSGFSLSWGCAREVAQFAAGFAT